jgi:hypothetical protein
MGVEMSGGSFGYVCFDVEDESKVFTCLDRLKDVESFLRSNGKHDAANEILNYRLTLETHQRIIMKLGHRYADLLMAAEWWASGDWGEEHLDERWNTLLEGKTK